MYQFCSKDPNTQTFKRTLILIGQPKATLAHVLCCPTKTSAFLLLLFLFGVVSLFLFCWLVCDFCCCCCLVLLFVGWLVGWLVSFVILFFVVVLLVVVFVVCLFIGRGGERFEGGDVCFAFVLVSSQFCVCLDLISKL